MKFKQNSSVELGLLLAISGWSAFTSGVGLFTIFSESKSVDLWQSIAAAAAGTIIIQALIIAFWRRTLTSGLGAIRVVALPLGIVFSLVSAGLASGSYLVLTNQADYQKLVNQGRAETVVKPLSLVRERADGLVRIMDQTSQAAALRARIEASRGGTCQGVRPRASCGPICRLRKRQSREARTHAKAARGISKTSIAIISDLQRDLTRQGMSRAYAGASALLSDSRLTAIQGWLNAELRGFKAFFQDPAGGAWFTCQDPGFVALLKKAKTSVNDVIGLKLPPVPPTPREVGYKEAIAKSYRDAFKLLGLLWSRNLTPQAKRSLEYSYAGYAIAGGVELAIIFLMLLIAADARHHGSDWDRPDRFLRGRRKLPAEQKAMGRRWLPLITRLLYEHRGRTFFARPLDGDPNVVSACSEAVLLLNWGGHKVLPPTVSLGDLDPDWVRSRDAVHGGASKFALHPLSNKNLHWLRKMIRDISFDPAPTPANPPDLKVVS